MLAADGEAYRDARVEQARRTGVADSVCFDADYRDVSSLTALIQSSAVVVLPYDSTDQVTSGVLVDAIASGRPVVATAFPHAVELLASGAGIVVDHDDPDALAIRPAPTADRAAAGRRPWPRRPAGWPRRMAWPVVANAYLGLAQRLLANRSVAGMTAVAPAPRFDHLLRMTDGHGTFEHARFAEPRPEHGYCTDDMARVLVVVTREPDAGRRCTVLRRAVQFLDEAQSSPARCRNRMDRMGRWTDEPCVGGLLGQVHLGPGHRRRAQ